MNKVYAASHPLRAQRDCYEVPEGSTVKEIVDLVDDNSGLRKHFVVYVGGKAVPQEYWQYVTPKANTNIAIRAVPMGGGDGDKDITRTILTIVVAVVSAYTGGAVGAAYGSAWGAAAGAAVSIVGRLVVDAIAPPPTPDELGGVDSGIDRDQRRPSIENARNRPARYQPIPRVYGTTRFVPPYSTLPYTEVRGNDQYLHFAVCWGYGPLQISDLRIGDTSVREFDNVLMSHNYGDGNGWTNGQIISNDVSEENLSVVLRNSEGYTIRTTEVETDEISVDIAFPQGLVNFTDDGNKQSRSVETRIQYSEAGQNNWINVIGGDFVNGTTITTPSYSGSSYPFGYTKRTGIYHSIYINPATGLIDSTEGEHTTYKQTPISGRETGQNLEIADGATIPDVPPGTYKLGRVFTQKEGDTDLGIVDVQETARPSDVFQNSDDFSLSINSGDNSKVDISSGTITGGVLNTKASSTSAVRNTYKWQVPKGQYDVRLRRETADSTDDQVRDQLVWSALRSIKHDEPVDPNFADSINLAQTQVTIKATDQLNGVVDQFNGVCSSILPQYFPDSDSWIEVVSNNPAAIVRDILQGNANKEPIPDSRIDLDAIESFSQRCFDLELDYNDVIQGGSVKDALKQVLSVARASHTMIDGVHSLVIDEEKTDVVQHFTPRNSKNFSGTKRFSKQPHAMKVPFNNRELGYTQDEAIAYDDGYSVDGTNCTFLDEDGNCNVATEFESVDIKGITDGEQAWRYGRYLLATNKLRPENYTLEVDLEHLVATRGDLVRITHDVPMFGLASGRVKSIETSGSDTTGVTLDQELELSANTDYTIRFRLANGDTLTRDIAQVGTDTTTKSVTFTTAITTSSGPQIGDLAMFGLQNEETVDCIIKEIQSSGADWGATLTLVDHAQPAIDDSADNSIPAFDSNISENPFTRQQPSMPIIEDITSDETVIIREVDNTFSARIVVSYKVPSTADVKAEYIQVRWRKVNEDSAWEYEEKSSQQGTISLLPVDQGYQYRIEARTVSQTGLTSGWTVAAPGHLVSGTLNPPPDVQNFSINVVDSTAFLTWQAVDVADLDHYEIRFDSSIDGSADWNSSVPIEENIPKSSNQFSTTNQIGTYLIKAVDRGGRKSVNAALVISSVADVLNLNVVGNLQEDPTFDGDKERVYHTSNYIQLGSAEDIDSWTSLDSIARLDVGTGLADEGIYTFSEFFDLGAVFTSRLSATIGALGIDLANTIGSWFNLADVVSLSGANPEDYNVFMEVRTTDDDPNSSPTWSAWERFRIGDYSARAFQFRTKLQSNRDTVAPRVNVLRVEIDMVDRTESDQIIVSDGQASISYSPAFKAKPEIGHTAEDINNGERVLFKNKSASGFDVEIRDATDSLVSGDRTLGWVAKGYGKQIN